MLYLYSGHAVKHHIAFMLDCYITEVNGIVPILFVLSCIAFSKVPIFIEIMKETYVVTEWLQSSGYSFMKSQFFNAYITLFNTTDWIIHHHAWGDSFLEKIPNGCKLVELAHWKDVWCLTICLYITRSIIQISLKYRISQERCTRFCCALLCCGYAIVHNEFTWSIYPYSSGLLCWHWGNH